jgi:hypothetical protein
MKFKDIQIGRCFYFTVHNGILHEKVSADSAQAISSVKAMTPFRVQPDAEVVKA